jgi:predicted signal transduction protein with EAL and GGDEF domain
MHVKLDYGVDGLEVDLPDEHVTIIEPRFRPAIADPHSALIAALRPSVIKIDRDIVHGIGHDDAKQALVEAFVSFSARIGARLLAEGIERRADLARLTALGVDESGIWKAKRPQR